MKAQKCAKIAIDVYMQLGSKENEMTFSVNVSKGIFIQLKYLYILYSVKDASRVEYIFIFVMEWPVCKVLNPITVCFNPAGGPRPLNMKI